MKNKTYLNILLILIAILFVFSGCSKEKVEGILPSDTDYLSTLDINTPEGLAKLSAETYKSLVNGEMDTEEGYQKIYDISSEASQTALTDQKGDFMDQLNLIKQSFKENPIIEFKFSKTEYSDENNASISRIQANKDGTKSYFIQDYIIENGVWKIKGDNAAAEFRIKDRFLFWYF